MQDAYTTLGNIKNFHRHVCLAQGVSEQTFQEHCQNLALSVDGVAESKAGKCKFDIVTVRFGPRAIYLLKTFNLLKSRPEARPTLEDKLRWVGFCWLDTAFQTLGLISDLFK